MKKVRSAEKNERRCDRGGRHSWEERLKGSIEKIEVGSEIFTKTECISSM